jgi:uncharacterized protein YdhG (YjbR/CyaY superfamily)
MPKTQSRPKRTAQSTKRTPTKVFSEAERAAMKEAIKEAKRGPRGKADGESDVLGKIAEMPPADRAIAERVHAIVKATIEDVEVRTWYGMPAYAMGGNVFCFFKPAVKFKARYATLGFSDKANLDEGAMWPTEFAVTKLTADVERRIAELVKRAVS